MHATDLQHLRDVQKIWGVDPHTIAGGGEKIYSEENLIWEKKSKQEN